MNQLLAAAASLAVIALPHAFAQRSCMGTTLSGTVRDKTLAVLPSASLSLDGSRSEVSGPEGQFRFLCVADGLHQLSAAAPGFGKRELSVNAPHMGDVLLVLQLPTVVTQLHVNNDAGYAGSATSSGSGQTISGSGIQSLADDPDDLLRELQQLASGGNQARVTIAVDGFRGASALPPKSSIAYIEINPDQFSAEYDAPPLTGGRVEVYTKPGQKTYHGALFTTNGSPWENARDPFSTSKAAIGKQLYGFELTGPVRKTGSDFAVTLEHRIMNNFAVVDAVTLNSSGDVVSTVANVSTPQSLWLGTARLDWQLGTKNTFIASYSANVNHLQNVGVGGTSLAETGYDSGQYEHMFRLSDVTTASAHFMHEARLSLRWDGQTDTPDSTAPQLQVAGTFTGGGATIGPQRLRELNIEADDDAILTTKKHTLKFGTQMMVYDERQQLTTNFNGTYTFGGGTAPVLDSNGSPISGQTQTITGVEQYRRALLGLAGGTPTAFSNVAGSPEVDFTQIQDALYIQDDWNPGHALHIAYGLRYFLENDPVVLSAITPRLGLLWSPDKNNRWTLHAHAGMFTGSFDEATDAEVRREDGVARLTSTIYNPVYGNPFAGATPINSLRRFSPRIAIDTNWMTENIGGTCTLGHGWNLSADYHFGRLWNAARSVNINSPLNDVPTGPRPGTPNWNVLQVQNSGQGLSNVTLVKIEQDTLKHIQLFFGGMRVKLVDDTGDSTFFTPQSSLTDAGEFAQSTGNPVWNLFGNGTFTLPSDIEFSGNFNASGDARYNITTGFDNNGDGDFNDRPQFALPGDPSAIATRYGLLVPTGGTGVFPRNKGVLPWTFYLDTNLQHSFTLTRDKKAAHQQTLTLNLRSSNVLNHLNVTQVGGVLASPLFGLPFSADNGRRVEGGLRYSF